MKIFRYIAYMMVFSWLCACTADDVLDGMENTPGAAVSEGIAILVSSNDLIPVNMNSRAVDLNGYLSKVNDLNIRVVSNGKTFYVYCKGTDLKVNGVSQTDKNFYIPNKDGNKVNLANGNKVFVHLGDVQSGESPMIEGVANLGREMGETDWNKIKELFEEGDEHLNQGYCMMYGNKVIKKTDFEPHEAYKCDVYQLDLKRTRAMLTVKINGKELHEGVSITPTRVTLKNLPVKCYVVPGESLKDTPADKQDENPLNNYADGKTVTTKNVEYSLVDLGWNGSVTRTSSVGQHDNEADAGSFRPMYLYENKQGKGANTVTPAEIKNKFPKGFNQSNASSNKTHSYIEIEADYRYELGGKLEKSGTIIYRFFLGEDDVNDFNVKRNTYYRLTLNLKNFGGANENGQVDANGKLVVNDKDLSWRVDLELRDWGFVKDEYTFDCHANFGYFEIMGSDWSVKSTGSYGTQFVKFYTAKIQDGVHWTENANSGYTVAEGGKLYYYMEPFYYNNYSSGYSYNKSRSTTVTLERTVNGKKETQTVTFTQYVPIQLTVDGKKVYMERFEENAQVAWGCVNQSLNQKVKLYEGSNNSIVSIWGKTHTYVPVPSSIKETVLNSIACFYADDFKQYSSDAHMYCLEKSGSHYMKETKVNETGLSGSSESIYLLPTQKIFEAMKAFDYTQLNKGTYEPLWDTEEYWTADIDEKNKTSFYWDGKNYRNDGDRSQKKRVRAVFINANEYLY